MGIMKLLQSPMETERLLLRKWRLSDFDDFVRLVSDPEVMLASGAKPAANLEEAVDLLMSVVKELRALEVRD